MIEPKIFYRELDSMLDAIRQEKSDKNFFQNILRALHQKFASGLNLANSHIFERRGDAFVRLKSCHEIKASIVTTFSINNDWVEEVLKKGAVIFNNPSAGKSLGLNHGEAMTVAAIHIHNPVRRWMFIFELNEGWIWDETMLFLNAMRTALNYRLFDEMMRNDLKAAEQIQKSLLPSTFPKIEGYDIFAHSQPAELVGGDFYDFFLWDEKDFGVSLGDASGHGVPAALLVRDVVIGLRMGLAKELRLVHTLKKLNQVIQQSTYSTNFVSIFVGEIESGGHLFYVNAGHPPPFIIQGEISHELPATGITLGFMPEIELQRSYRYLEPGSILVLYSDGIAERQNSLEEQFELPRLKRLVSNNQHKSAKEIVKLIFDTVYDFGSQSPWEDDATLAVIKRLV
ncbi:MAG TPA: hypothetical protein ENN03_11380 [bacterium]|nr:hypothetical protein [bacterium]